MKKPNFFIIGAPKCGTTSLAAWLAEHPNIYMSPIKEPGYFASDIRNKYRVTDWKQYLRLFAKATGQEPAIGEASTIYLFSKEAVPAIESTIDEARYLVMMRNPVEMAYALHEQRVRQLREDVMDFQKAWNLVEKRQQGRRVPRGCEDPNFLDYPSWCRLGEQLERLYSIVPRDRVLVLVLDDVKKDPRREYRRVLEFLGITDDRKKEFPVHNPAQEWRFKWVGRSVWKCAEMVGMLKRSIGILAVKSFGIIRAINKLNTRKRERPELPVVFRKQVAAYFAPDIRKLEELLGRDLSHWLKMRRKKDSREAV